MTAAQVAFVALTVGFLAGAVVLTITEYPVMAWACWAVATFGFLALVGMLFSDRRPSG